MSKSRILVLIQFTCIGFFLLRHGLWPSSWLGLIVEVTGIGIGLWAIITMNIRHVSVFPEPKHEASLVASGPYHWIRHPMYTAVLLVCASLALDSGNLLDGIVYLVLLVNQWVKLRFEEELLKDRYPQYSAYMGRTKALIPFIL